MSRQERFSLVAAAKQKITDVDVEIDNVEVWTLRGYASSYEEIATAVIEKHRMT